MFIIETIYKISKGILASIGMCFLTTIYMCLFTNTPTELFKQITVKPDIKKADVIIVLGAGVTENGWPGANSLARSSKGVILYKKNYAPKIIFSGGWDHNGYIASAKAMKSFAIDLGVRPEDIIIEDQSRDTYQNALNSSKIMQYYGFRNAILVTSDSHMRRSMAVFNKLRVPVCPAPVEEELIKPELNWKSKIHNFSILYQVLYESTGILKYRSKGYI